MLNAPNENIDGTITKQNTDVLDNMQLLTGPWIKAFNSDLFRDITSDKLLYTCKSCSDSSHSLIHLFSHSHNVVCRMNRIQMLMPQLCIPIKVDESLWLCHPNKEFSFSPPELNYSYFNLSSSVASLTSIHWFPGERQWPHHLPI